MLTYEGVSSFTLAFNCYTISSFLETMRFHLWGICEGVAVEYLRYFSISAKMLVISIYHKQTPAASVRTAVKNRSTKRRVFKKVLLLWKVHPVRKRTTEECCFATVLVGGIIEDVSASSSCQTTSWTHSFILRLLISCMWLRPCISVVAA